MRHAMQPWFEDYDDASYVRNLVEVLWQGIGLKTEEVQCDD